MESSLPEIISEETRVEQVEKLIELMGTGNPVHKFNKQAMWKEQNHHIESQQKSSYGLCQKYFLQNFHSL